MPLRQFTDERGVDWQVWDTLPEKLVSNTLEGGWLTFEAIGEKRRLAPIPLYWAKASDEELRTLLGRARVVTGTPHQHVDAESRPDGR